MTLALPLSLTVGLMMRVVQGDHRVVVVREGAKGKGG
jgi:hypothetical protein